MSRPAATMSAMGCSSKRTSPGCLFPAALMAAVLAASSCDKTVPPSPDNLKLEVKSDSATFLYDGNFSGTLTFVNRSWQKIRETFPSLGQYHVGLYDTSGRLRRDHFPNAQYPAVSCFELEPLATRTETLRFSLSVSPDTILYGWYTVRAWIEGHSDIYSETTIYIRT